MMHGSDGMMMGTMGVGGFLWFVILLGIAVLVWLWVVKLWKEVKKK